MIKYIVLNDGTRYVKGGLYDDEHTIRNIIYHDIGYVLVLTTEGKPVARVIVQSHAVRLAFVTIEDES